MVNVMDRPGDVKRAAMAALGDQIADEAAHLDAAMHRLLTHIREFDAASGWGHAGAQSCAHWLSWRVGWTLGTGRERVRVARRLGELPRVDEALRQGKLSYAKVRAITRVASPTTEELLLGYALVSTGAQLETICRKFRAVQRLAGASAREVDDERRVTRRDLDDGMVRIEATLRPEEAAMVMAAIEQVARAGQSPGQGGSEPRPPRFDRADALVWIAQTIMRGERVECAPVEVVMTVSRTTLTQPSADDDVAQIGVFTDGTCVSAETARRLTCDCGVVEVVEDEHGNPLSVGRRTRTIPAALKRALLHRDGACRFPGCTDRVFLEGHHLVHWALGGETSLENTCLLCTRHHAFVHDHGYRIDLVDGEVRVHDPRGRLVPHEGPRPAPDSVTAWERIRDDNRPLGITPATNAPSWDGGRADYDLIVGGLARRDGLCDPPSWSIRRALGQREDVPAAGLG